MPRPWRRPQKNQDWGTMPGDHVRTSHFCSPRVTWAIQFLFLNPVREDGSSRSPKDLHRSCGALSYSPIFTCTGTACVLSIYCLRFLLLLFFQHSLIWPRLASPQSHCGAKDDLKLLTFRPLPPQGLLTSTSHHSWFIHFFFLNNLS